LLKKIILFVLFCALLMAASLGYWGLRPLPLTAPSVDLSIEPQTSVRGMAQAAVAAGIDVQPSVLYWFFRLSGQSRNLRA